MSEEKRRRLFRLRLPSEYMRLFGVKRWLKGLEKVINSPENVEKIRQQTIDLLVYGKVP
jgi:hypothetical protein